MRRPARAGGPLALALALASLGVPAVAAPGLEQWQPLARNFFESAPRARCASRGVAGDWRVAREGERVVVRTRSPRGSDLASLPIPATKAFSGRRVVLERPDGVWLGIDRTELGGGLWWLPRTSPAPVPERVSQENVQGIVRIGARTIVLSGLAFMNWDQGALLEPERREDGSRGIGRIFPLGAAPKAFVVDRGDDGERLWIVTGKGVSSFDGERVRQRHRGRYGGLVPDSIALDAEGRIFIGMRHVVVRLSPARRGFHEDWLVPPWCMDIEPGTCACRPGRDATPPDPQQGEPDPWPTTKASPSASDPS